MARKPRVRVDPTILARTWREEVTFTSDEDAATTQKAIDEFLEKSDTKLCDKDHTTWDAVQASAMTGIPKGESMETPAPTQAATAVTVKSEYERSVHPEFCGVKYDELHSSTVKHMQQVTQQWPPRKVPTM